VVLCVSVRAFVRVMFIDPGDTFFFEKFRPPVFFFVFLFRVVFFSSLSQLSTFEQIFSLSSPPARARLANLNEMTRET
jgi:hypothetical protein